MFTFTVHDLLAKNLDHRADHPALILGEVELTYAELGRRVDQVAHFLLERGVERGDRVAVHLHKSLEEVISIFAIARIGAVWVDVNYQWTADQLAYIVHDCGVKTLITDRRKAKLVVEGDLAATVETVLVKGKPPEHAGCFAWSALAADVSVDLRGPVDKDLAALLYTSGSTGKPKGVMLTHANVVQGARIVAKYVHNTPDDRILGLLPFNFDAGLSQITTAFLVGATVVVQPVPLAAEVVKTAIEQRVTGIGAVPPAWIPIVRYLQETGTRLPDLRYMTNTGGKIPPNILDVLPEVFPGVDIYLMYGLTEAFRSTYLPPAEFATKKGSIGRAIPNVEIYVIDPERGICGPGEQGELVHRGALISRGYWGKPEATAEKLRVNEHLVPLIGDEPVLHSGDLVRLDEDGVLWFVGRMDGMLKSSGFRISPTEVEDIVHQSGLVGEVVAFGVEDEELGQKVHIAVAAPGGSGTVDAETLERYCSKAMPHYMVPGHIHCWDGAMPLTANGKVDRPHVVKRCREALA